MAAKIRMLALSPTMESGTIVRWVLTEGSAFTAGDVLCEVETDKATMDYEATSSGNLLKILVPQGSKVVVGDAIALSGTPGEDISAYVNERAPVAARSAGEVRKEPGGAVPATQTPAGSHNDETSAGHFPDGVRASPLARVLARKKGISISLVKGSGPGGRVVKTDIEQYRGTVESDSLPKITAAAPDDTIVPVSEKRKIIATRMHESVATSPHFSLTVSVQMDTLLANRAQVNAHREAKISFNAFLVKLVAEALHRHPEVNASWNGETITRHGTVAIALAVALQDGLVTPVVHNAANKGIEAIDKELSELISRARAGKLTPQEYTGSTFTISNLGSYGVREFTAIINPPNAAILAVGEVFREPFEKADGSIGFRSAMSLTLSCDHRLIDGAVAADFARDLKLMIEQPIMALL